MTFSAAHPTGGVRRGPCLPLPCAPCSPLTPVPASLSHALLPRWGSSRLLGHKAPLIVAGLEHVTGRRSGCSAAARLLVSVLPASLPRSHLACSDPRSHPGSLCSSGPPVLQGEGVLVAQSGWARSGSSQGPSGPDRGVGGPGHRFAPLQRPGWSVLVGHAGSRFSAQEPKKRALCGRSCVFINIWPALRAASFWPEFRGAGPFLWGLL